ncbi:MULTISPECIES: VWA domain-containing protein [unclassified Streptomyces]|uniref:VWA domain-containing protein n=1 Tax=unclassified Streptomyces TaxID=2593676 RepID=UPI0004BD60F7|nr:MULTISPECIES: VWA domain-containing protein [unclassified Streptomyces]
MSLTLPKGGNAPLPTARCTVTVPATAAGAATDVCAVLLATDGAVRSDDDLVFYNHPAQDGVVLGGRTIVADLPAVPASVVRIAIVATIDPMLAAAHFTAADTPRAVIECGGVRIGFEPPPFTHRETAAVLVELYRREGAWKVRAVGQGWDTGLAGLATAFGIVVDDATPTPAPAAAVASTVAVTPVPTPVQVPAPVHVSAPVQAPVPVPAAAMSLEKVQRAAPGLVNLYKAAQVSLAKSGVMGQRAAVYLVLDHSGSMIRFYRDGTMQHLAEQVLGLSVNLDDDGTVPLLFFSNGVDLIADLNLENYRGRIERLHAPLDWGGTCYTPAMLAVIEHYQATGSRDPAFVVFQTDGEPFDRQATRELLRRASALPIFWQFVGFGPSRDLRFLRSLDTLDRRTVDNAGYFAAGRQPASRSDADLYDRLMKEFPDWLQAARAAGVIR